MLPDKFIWKHSELLWAMLKTHLKVLFVKTKNCYGFDTACLMYIVYWITQHASLKYVQNHLMQKHCFVLWLWLWHCTMWHTYILFFLMLLNGISGVGSDLWWLMWQWWQDHRLLHHLIPTPQPNLCQPHEIKARKFFQGRQRFEENCSSLIKTRKYITWYQPHNQTFFNPMELNWKKTSF